MERAEVVEPESPSAIDEVKRHVTQGQPWVTSQIMSVFDVWGTD